VAEVSLSAAVVAGPAIEGERLAVPYGATRLVPDYGRPRASYVFLALVSVISLAADVASKSWAEHHLDSYPGTVEVWKNHVTLLLAKNRGGAWGLLQSTSENVRRPFFLLVSVAAIAFIMTLYRRLQPRQLALKWGLPLVLGGALGNVFDRIRYGHVIDFIDCHLLWKGVDKHWPTFNIADVAICVGVGLMAIDMFSAKRATRVLHSSPIAPAQSGEPSAFGSALDPHVDEPPPPAETAAVNPASVEPPVDPPAADPKAE
jgi:lipoprotein signal peptidase